MPTFKPEDLQDAKPITFSAQDLTDAATATSTQKPMELRDLARLRLGTGMKGLPGQQFPSITPEQIKKTPDIPPPGQYDIKTKVPKTFGKALGEFFNPFAQAAPMMAETLDTESKIPGTSIPTSMLDPMTRLGVKTIAGLNPYTFAKESYRRGESGQSTQDLYAVPAGLALTLAAPKAARAVLPADIAAELATRAQRGALGTTKESFTHGATPDVATLQDPAGSVYRSQGRQLKGILADKAGELDALEKDMSAPKYQNAVSDPMTSIKPVMDDALSRATPTEGTRINEFNSLILSKIRNISNGTMQLNPSQLVQLKRWTDGFISTYRDEPVGTLRDLAQNTYSAIRQHLAQVAPESAVRGQRIQSLIAAEEALHNKIYTPLPEAKTVTGDIKRMFDPIVPSTLLRTSTAAALKGLSGGLLDRPPLPTGTGTLPGGGSASTGIPPEPGAGPQGPQGPINITPWQNPPGPPRQITGGQATLPPGAQGGLPPAQATIDVAPGETPSTPTGAFPKRPTHIEEGQQVSGHTPDGTLVSGQVQKIYAVINNGVPEWRALVLDHTKGRVVELPANQTFNRLTGPPPATSGGGSAVNPKGISSSEPFSSQGEEMPFQSYSPLDKVLAEKLNINPENPFPSEEDLTAKILQERQAHKIDPVNVPKQSRTTAEELKQRAKTRPPGTTLVLDKTKETPGLTAAQPEEMALVKDAVARITDNYPKLSKYLSRVEIEHTITKPEIMTSRTKTPVAYYSDLAPGRISIDLPTLRREIAGRGLASVDATLHHELTHLAQHILGVKGELEASAYRNTFRSLGNPDTRYFGPKGPPLSPAEIKQGPEFWRLKSPAKTNIPDPNRFKKGKYY